MLDAQELRDVAERFGVADDQVRRDHVVSHLLVAVADLAREAVFFGGTALARTHLPDGRLSEDVDLYTDHRAAVVRRLARGLPVALRKEFPGLRWDVPPDQVGAAHDAVVVAPGIPPVRLQVLDRAGYAHWPTERRRIDVRYGDLAEVEMTVPTRASFVGMKVWAWAGRRAARDLYDLWALAARDAVDAAAVAAFEAAVGYPPLPALFDHPPDPVTWRVALGHQTGNLPGPADAAAAVRAAFIRALDSP